MPDPGSDDVQVPLAVLRDHDPEHHLLTCPNVTVMPLVDLGVERHQDSTLVSHTLMWELVCDHLDGVTEVSTMTMSRFKHRETSR